MLKLITRNYKSTKKHDCAILIKSFTSRRNVSIGNHYLELRRRINFSRQQYYDNKTCSEIIRANKNNNPYKNMANWNVVSYFLLLVGMMGYLLVNNRANADAEENDNKIDDSDLQLREKLKRLSIKLMEGLPEPVENYVDFQGKKELIDEKLKQQNIIVISGAGGMGKSSLAAQYAHECQQKGDLQVIWIKGMQIEEEFFRFAGLLGIETSDLNSEIIKNLVYSNLEMFFDKRSLLFIFDNVETKEKIRQYLISLPYTAKVIITARNGDILDGVEPIQIKGFKEEEADFYLRQALKISEEEARKIVNVVGDESPFRLSIVVGYLKNHPLTSIEELTKQYHEIKSGYSANEEIYPEFKMLFRDLEEDSPKAWELLKYLAYLDAEGVSVPLIGEIMGQTIKELQETINKIRELSLIKANDRNVQVTHRIIQEETKKAIREEDKEQKEEERILAKLICKLNEKLPYIDAQSKALEDLAELARHGQKVIEVVGNFEIENIENLLEKIGNYYFFRVFDFKKAIDCLEKALNRRKHTLTSQSDDVVRSLNHLGIVYQKLGGEENILKSLKYHNEALKMSQALHLGNDPHVLQSLNNVGVAYRKLGGKKNILLSLKYHIEALKMGQALYPGNHLDVARSLKNLGLAYKELKGRENILKSLQYQEEGLKMIQALYPDNHPYVAITLNYVGITYETLEGEENISKGLKYQEEGLKMSQALYSDKHPYVAISLSTVGRAYKKLGGEENILKGLKYQEEGLKMFQALYFDKHPHVAISLAHVGGAYQELGGEENILKGLKYQEEGLKMFQDLFSNNNRDLLELLCFTGKGYEQFGDRHKALEYYKQAYGMFFEDQDYECIQYVKSRIESLQPKFFDEQNFGNLLEQIDCGGGSQVGPECRWMISSRGKVDNDLLILKKKIQESVLNNIVESVDKYGWSRGWSRYDRGVKGYIAQNYLYRKLEELRKNKDKIELAQMLCFEAMNLGIMKLEKNKPYSIVQEFTRNNPELVKKIAVEHPEFFVDGSIVEACVKAMPDDPSFEAHLFNHVKYMGMNQDKKEAF